MPKVSVIMCAYNTQAYIEQAIQSILNQTYTNWELVISDDCSTDNTVTIVEKYLHDKRIKLFRLEKNLGYIRNKNYAFQQATGDLLTQLDADDLCPPDRLAKQVAVFNHSDIQICGTNYNLINSEDNIKAAHKEYLADKLVTDKNIGEEYPFWFPSLMFTRKILDQFGLFSAYFIGTVGDDEYWTYRVNAKYPIYFVKDPLYNYRIHNESLTGTFDKPRKMIVAEILNELKRQQNETGTDLLEQGQFDKMRAFEEAVLSNKKIMAEKTRIWAAKAIDNNQFDVAFTLLKKAASLNGITSSWLRTCLYYLKRKFGK